MIPKLVAKCDIFVLVVRSSAFLNSGASLLLFPGLDVLPVAIPVSFTPPAAFHTTNLHSRLTVHTYLFRCVITCFRVYKTIWVLNPFLCIWSSLNLFQLVLKPMHRSLELSRGFIRKNKIRIESTFGVLYQYTQHTYNKGSNRNI